MGFNPRSHEGSDSFSCFFFSSADCVSIHAPTKGATFCVKHFIQSCIVSIHAPTKGATTVRCSTFLSSSVSIHAPTKGATSKTGGVVWRQRMFQSTLPRRERPDVKLVTFMGGAFQSTLPRRERREQMEKIVFIK